jgi:hypothetical protein
MPGGCTVLTGMPHSTDEPDNRSQSLTIEVGAEPRTTICERCGRAAVQTTGFVYRAGNAFAIYHATLHRHDNVHRIDLAIGIGTWQADDAVADVSAFLAVWPEDDEIRFGFVDPAQSVWSGAGLLRNQLTAEQARVSTSRDDLLRVAEGVVKDDPAVARHLD